MTVSLQPGNVIKYDYLWNVEAELGKSIGLKDRPCAVVLTMDTKNADGRTFQKIYIAAITHTAPATENKTTGIRIPGRVAEYLGLDDQPQWIITSELNSFDLFPGTVPLGLVPAVTDQYIYGSLPDALYVELFKTIKENLHKIGAVTDRG